MAAVEWNRGSLPREKERRAKGVTIILHGILNHGRVWILDSEIGTKSFSRKEFVARGAEGCVRACVLNGVVVARGIRGESRRR